MPRQQLTIRPITRELQQTSANDRTYVLNHVDIRPITRELQQISANDRTNHVNIWPITRELQLLPMTEHNCCTMLTFDQSHGSYSSFPPWWQNIIFEPCWHSTKHTGAAANFRQWQNIRFKPRWHSTNHAGAAAHFCQWQNIRFKPRWHSTNHTGAAASANDRT